VTFSTLYEVVSSFNRDLESIRDQLKKVAFYDGTNFETLLHGISTVVLDTWGTTVPVQILLITDGTGGFGPGCLKDTIRTAKPFTFPAKMNILSISKKIANCINVLYLCPGCFYRFTPNSDWFQVIREKKTTRKIVRCYRS